MKVELSGGIRDDESLTRALATGAARVNIGTAALEDPEWCDRVCGEYGDRVAIGLDVRGRTLSARGWTRDGGDLYEVLARLDKAGAARYVVTDITKDGTMRGPNLDLLREVCAQTDKPVIASGGVSTLDDLRALATLESAGVEGVIAGKALYAGAFTVPRGADGARAGMSVERFGSGGPWEAAYGYSRVVRAGDLVLTAGCTSTVDGVVTGVGDAHAQARTALGIALAALRSAGRGGRRRGADPDLRHGPRERGRRRARARRDLRRGTPGRHDGHRRRSAPSRHARRVRRRGLRPGPARPAA